ncbi:phosphoglycerate mutase family protein [Tritrichomonas foetus]|uniref:phosphoglycerate mutase (2,3-diphosphoglycerate-dependent) n=1 Tax=Tritrichomonas foetus TaxID=1144522 RepID=A0A1J4JAC7_9EUKA|nr:phosphoglycerate mutase family protein [Tritrichomonas foetus]|eukprot:OHS96104.1 phosphoglycerate mutase family protein [Tritrichomonas foetus]
MISSFIRKKPSFLRNLLKTNAQGNMPVQLGLLNMPNDLVLVRHGASEGNLAFEEERKGNYQLFSPQFMETHESKWRLTDRGREQARAAGDWIRDNINVFFGVYFCSEYVRAIETASLLKLPHAHWIRHVFLRERNFGRIAGLSYKERLKRFEDQLKRSKRDFFYWRPPSGESLAEVALRIDYILDKLSNKAIFPSSAIIVSHFNVMQVFRARIEMIHQSDFAERLVNVPPEQKIKNCCIIHYTRTNPETKEIAPVYKWMRIAIPYLKEYSNPPWTEIKYSYLANDDLQKEFGISGNENPII